MSEAKKLNIGRELTDEELMEMTGGSTFSIQCQKDYTYNHHCLLLSMEL